MRIPAVLLQRRGRAPQLIQSAIGNEAWASCQRGLQQRDGCGVGAQELSGRGIIHAQAAQRAVDRVRLAGDLAAVQREGLLVELGQLLRQVWQCGSACENSVMVGVAASGRADKGTHTKGGDCGACHQQHDCSADAARMAMHSSLNAARAFRHPSGAFACFAEFSLLDVKLDFPLLRGCP